MAHDDHIENMVLAHDKHLDRLTTSVETLAVNVGSTNKKLDDVIEVISAQNVMVERMNNMDLNIKEFAVDMRGKVKVIEQKLDGDGGVALKVATVSINSLGKSLDSVRARVSEVEETQNISVNSTVLRWAGGIVVAAFISLLTFIGDQKSIVKNDIHILDKTLAGHVEQHRSDRRDVLRRLGNLEDPRTLNE